MNTPEKPDYGEPWKKYDENGIQSRDEFWIADVKTPSIRDRIAACVNACAGMDDPAKEIEAAEREAVTLAKSMHRRHYAESAPQWECLSDVPGIISQIDNMHAGVCQQLAAAQAKLSSVYQWIERHSQDGFINGLTHDQNLDRIADAWADKEETMREAIKAAHGALEYVMDELCTARSSEKAIDAIAKLEPYIKP